METYILSLTGLQLEYIRDATCLPPKIFQTRHGDETVRIRIPFRLTKTLQAAIEINCPVTGNGAVTLVLASGNKKIAYPFSKWDATNIVKTEHITYITGHPVAVRFRKRPTWY